MKSKSFMIFLLTRLAGICFGSYLNLQPRNSNKDPITQNYNYSYNDYSANFTVKASGHGNSTISNLEIEVSSSYFNWFFNFESEINYIDLEQGKLYEDALNERVPGYNLPVLSYLGIRYDYELFRECIRGSVGWFRINSLNYSTYGNNTQIDLVDISFEQKCKGSNGSSYGTISYRRSSPDPTPTPTPLFNSNYFMFANSTYPYNSAWDGNVDNFTTWVNSDVSSFQVSVFSNRGQGYSTLTFKNYQSLLGPGTYNYFNPYSNNTSFVINMNYDEQRYTSGQIRIHELVLFRKSSYPTIKKLSFDFSEIVSGYNENYTRKGSFYYEINNESFGSPQVSSRIPIRLLKYLH